MIPFASRTIKHSSYDVAYVMPQLYGPRYSNENYNIMTILISLTHRDFGSAPSSPYSYAVPCYIHYRDPGLTLRLFGVRESLFAHQRYDGVLTVQLVLPHLIIRWLREQRLTAAIF